MAAQDVAPELLEAVREAFERGMAQDEQLVRLLANITEGGATFADAGEYAARVGEALAAAFGECLSSEVLPEGRMWYNIADRVVRPMLEEDHRLVTTAAAETITAQNRGAGIGMTAQTAPVDEDRIQGILDRVSSEPVYDDAAWLLDAPVVTFSQAAADETLKRNVGVMGKSGLRARIIRKAEHKCCAWCSGLAGTYDYPGAPDDVYRRHENCRCVVEYDPGKGKQRQNVHSKEWTDADERAKIETRKGVKLLSSAGRRYDEDIVIGRSLGAKAKNYDIVLPNREIVHLTEGTRITQVQTIAGLGRNRKIDIVDFLVERYPGSDAEKWQKKKGVGYVDYQGESYRAELHWYEEPSCGRVEFKVKPDADGNWFYEDE